MFQNNCDYWFKRPKNICANYFVELILHYKNLNFSSNNENMDEL